MDELAARVQDLPVELFDIIRDLVFTAPESSSVTITPAYKLPPQLQVSRATREQFAKSYYKNTTFHYKEREEWDLVVFLRSLPATHRLAITTIHMDRGSWWYFYDLENHGPGEAARAIRRHLRAWSGRYEGLMSSETILQTDVAEENDKEGVDEKILRIIFAT